MRSLGKRPKIAALSNCDECWGKILLVDRPGFRRDIFSRKLTKLKFTVVVASSINQGHRILRGDAQTLVDSTPFCCAILSAATLVDLHPGEHAVARQQRIVSVIARLRTELHRQSSGLAVPVVAFGKSAANALLQRIVFGAPEGAADDHPAGETTDGHPVGETSELVDHFLDLPMALDRVAQRIRAIALHSSETAAAKTRTLHVTISSTAPDSMPPSDPNRTPLAELSRQVSACRKGHRRTGAPVTLASVQSMTSVRRPNSANSLRSLKPDKNKCKKIRPVASSDGKRQSTRTNWVQAYAQTALLDQRVGKFCRSDNQSMPRRKATRISRMVVNPGSEPYRRDKTSILRNLMAGRPSVGASVSSKMRSSSSSSRGAKRISAPNRMRRKHSADKRRAYRRRQSERPYNTLALQMTGSSATGSSAPRVAKSQLVANGMGYHLSANATDCRSGKHVWLSKTNRCRVCGALKDEEFIRRAFAHRQRAMDATQYEYARAPSHLF